ncbi:MAG: HAD-IA family hydrolase [Eubacteriales bacterium]|nr:HAD-IA family hydrolase [Eubacteriales bacterium]
MACKVLLSDADGTLFDFEAGERNAIASVFAAFHIPVNDENIAVYHRVNDLQWKRLERGETTQARLRVDRFADFLRETGYTADAIQMCAFFVAELGKQSIPLPGAKAFCEAVSALMPIYLVTNGIAEVQHHRFDPSVLAPYLKGLIISEEVGYAKPDPAMVLEALRQANVSPSDAVLLGDSVTADIPAARNAGVRSILFTNGTPPPLGHGADFTVSTLSQAAELIQRLANS